MLDVGKPCTSTSAGAPGVPQRRLNTATSRPSLAAVVERQRSSVPPACPSVKMSKPPASHVGMSNPRRRRKFGYCDSVHLTATAGLRTGDVNPEGHLVDVALIGRGSLARPGHRVTAAVLGRLDLGCGLWCLIGQLILPGSRLERNSEAIDAWRFF